MEHDAQDEDSVGIYYMAQKPGGHFVQLSTKYEIDIPDIVKLLTPEIRKRGKRELVFFCDW